VAIAALALIALAACGGGDRPRVTIAAAADLQYAFTELKAPFEEQCDCELVLTFGSSGRFAVQIAEGLQADVFASADIGYVEELEARGLVVDGTKQVYAIGRIVIAVPVGSDLDPADIGVVADPRVRRVSIANPGHAPYGVAAQEALEAAGLWETVQGKLVLGENAAQASQFVETGDADAGVIPLSLAMQREDRLRYTLIDEAMHNRLNQAAAIISRARQPELARDFLEFINGPQGRPVMEAFGFVLPGEEAAR
jgi:molybdate transport system substrate-binding protein